MMSLVQRAAATVLPSVTLVETPVLGTPGSWGSNTSFHGVSFRQRTISSGHRKYQYSTDPQSSFVGTRPPDLATATDGQITRSSGVDRECFGLFGNSVGKIVRRLDFRDTGSLSETEILGVVADSYLEHSANIVLTLLASGKSREIYLPNGNRNADSWWPHSALTAVPYSNAGSGQKCAVAITPRHVLTSNHYIPTNGAEMVWKTLANGTISRTVLNSARCDWSDLRVATLSSDLPSSISPLPVVSSDWFGNRSGGQIASQHAGIWQDQHRQACFVHVAQRSLGATVSGPVVSWAGLSSADFLPVDQVTTAPFADARLPDLAPYAATVKNIAVDGDSGLAWLVPIAGGQWAVAGAFASGFSSPRLYTSVLNAAIAAADTAAGVSTGYTVTVANEP